MKRYFYVIALMLLLPLCSFAQLAQQVDFINGGIADSSGSPLVSGTVGFYEVGYVGNAAYYKDTWDDASRAATSTNPITLGAGGRDSVFASGRYDIQVKDSDGVVVFNILGASYGVGAGSVLSETYTFTAAATDPTITLSNSYETGANKIAVYLNGVRQHSITETSSTQVTLTGTYLTGWELFFEILP